MVCSEWGLLSLSERREEGEMEIKSDFEGKREMSPKVEEAIEKKSPLLPSPLLAYIKKITAMAMTLIMSFVLMVGIALGYNGLITLKSFCRANDHLLTLKKNKGG